METAGQAKMTWTDVNTSPTTSDLGYFDTVADDTLVACLADDGTGVAASPTCGVLTIPILDTTGLVLPGALATPEFDYTTPN